jgi:hypothetical protein
MSIHCCTETSPSYTSDDRQWWLNGLTCNFCNKCGARLLPDGQIVPSTIPSYAWTPEQAAQFRAAWTPKARARRMGPAWRATTFRTIDLELEIERQRMVDLLRLCLERKDELEFAAATSGVA